MCKKSCINSIVLAIVAFLTAVSACKKKDKTPPTPEPPAKYFNYNANSVWNYQSTDNVAGITTNSTLTCKGTDTTYNGQTFKVYTRSNSRNEYYRNSGNDYFNIVNIEIAGQPLVFENKYLQEGAPVGTSWSLDRTISPQAGINVNTRITNTVQAVGLTRTVNGVTYTDVIQMGLKIEILPGTIVPPSALTNNITSYFARKVGLIENSTVINFSFLGNQSSTNSNTRLMSSNLK